MTKIAALLAAAALTLTTAPRAADACGDYGSFQRRETAVGIWPTVHRARDGAARLELHYPKFTLSGDYFYMHAFDLVADAQLRRLERALAAPDGRSLEVTLQEVSPGRWRVRSWAKRAAGA